MFSFLLKLKRFSFHISFAVLCCGMIPASSCKKNLDFQGSLVDVSKDFNAKMWQLLNDNGGDFALVFSTTQVQKCPSTSVNAYPNVYSDNVIVTIKDLSPPAVCAGTGDYARDTTYVTHLANGSYSFQLNLKDIVFNKGTLVVADNKYSLTMNTQNGVNIDAADLMRVPTNIVWGLVNYDADAAAQADLFLNELKSLGYTVSLDNGEYGHFQIKDGSISLPAENTVTRTNTKKFIFKLNNAVSNLSDTVKKYRQQYSTKMSFSVNTWNGKSL